MFTNGISVFEKEPVYVGETKTATGDFAIVRLELKDDPTKRIMGYCTSKYHLVQPIDLIHLFDEKVGAPVESMGFLGKGEKMFVSWALPTSRIVVGKNDEVNLFGAILAGFDAKVSISHMIASYRPVCENTFMSLSNMGKKIKSKDGSQGRVFVGHHNSPNIMRDLGAWLKHTHQEAANRAKLLEGFFNQIAAFPIKSEKSLADILFSVYPDTDMPASYPSELRDEKAEKVDKANELAERDRINVTSLFNGMDKTLVDTSGWSLFNSITGYENRKASKKDATASILFGERSRIMNNAFVTIYQASIKQ